MFTTMMNLRMAVCTAGDSTDCRISKSFGYHCNVDMSVMAEPPASALLAFRPSWKLRRERVLWDRVDLATEEIALTVDSLALLWVSHELDDQRVMTSHPPILAAYYQVVTPRNDQPFAGCDRRSRRPGERVDLVLSRETMAFSISIPILLIKRLGLFTSGGSAPASHSART